MRIHTKWYEYCSNCSNRVEIPETDIPEETLIECKTCGNREYLDITVQNRPE